MALNSLFSPNGLSVGNLFNPTDVVLANGDITAGNTVTANYFLGNGAFLTGIAGGGGSYGNANVANYLASNANVTILTTGNITTSANVTGNNFNGTSATLAGNLSAGNVSVANGNITVGNLVGAGTNVEIVSGAYTWTFDGAGNLTGNGNISAGNFVGTAGNTSIVTSAYAWIFNDAGNLVLPGNSFSVNYANGTQVALGGSYSNSVVANYLASNAAVTILTTGNITTAANIAGNYFIGNGALLTGVVTSSYSNANVANYLPTYTGNVGAGNLNLTGNIVDTGAIFVITGANGNVVLAPNGTSRIIATGSGANVIGNLDVAGNVNANGATLTGNITAGNLSVANGNITLGNLVGSGTNVEIVSGAYTWTFDGAGNLTGNGNISAGNFVGTAGNTSIVTNAYSWTFNDAGNLVLPGNTFAVNYANGTPVLLSGTYANSNVSAYLASNAAVTILTTGNITTAANVSGAYVLGNGAFLSGLPVTYSNSNVAAYLAVYNGNALFSNITVSQDAVVLGNLRVEGNTTYINVTDLVIEDKDIIVAANATATLTDLNGAGLQIGNRTAGGNITFFYNSISNVMSLSHGANIANVLNVTGNITATGNTTSGNVNLTGNIVDTGALTIITGAAGNITLAPNSTSVLIATTTGVNIAGYLNTTGNISAGNVIGSGNNVEVTAGSYNWAFDNTGNFTLSGNTFAVNYANGTQVALGGNYSNTNVAAYLASNTAVTILTTANITTAANIAGNYFIGNGALLTGVVTSSYSNANVANYLPTYTGNVSAGNLNLTGNIVDTGALTIITGSAGNITLAPGNTTVLTVTTTGVNVSGTFNATGNISAGNLIGSGNNVEVTAGSYNWVFDNTGNFTLAGNTFGINYANGSQVSLSGTYSNTNVAAYLPTYTGAINSLTGNVVTTANVSAAYLLGNGYFVSGIQYSNITGAYGNANVKTYLESGATINANFGGGNITTTGTANLGITQVNGNLVVAGNISATGNITYINVSDLVVSDPLIFLAANNPGDVQDIGLVANYNPGGGNLHTGFARDYTDSTWKVFDAVTSEPNTVIAWNQAVMAPFKAGSILSNATITANANVTAVGNVSGTYILGNGAFLTGLPAGYSNADVANYLASNAAVTILTTGNITTSANVTGNNFNGTGATLTGNLSAGNVSVANGNITVGNTVTANYFLGNGAFLTGIPVGNTTVSNTAPVGAQQGDIWIQANTGIQYIYFTSSGNSQWAEMEAAISISTTGGDYGNSDVAAYLASGSLASNIISSANISGSYFVGNGSQLTGIDAGYSNVNVKAYLGNFDGNIIPSANVTFDLGSNSNRWNDLYLNNSTIYIGTQEITANASTTVFSGNIAANYLFGNASFLSGVSNYSNANVANYLPNYQGVISNVDFRSTSPAAVALVVTDRPLTMGGNTLSYVTLPDDGNANSVAAELTNHGLGNVLISTGPADYEWVFDHTGNVTLPSNTFGINYANGSQVSLSGSYSNANVANYLPTYQGNLSAGNISVIGNISTQNDITAVTITTENTGTFGNVSTAGTMAATGNVSGGNLISNNTISGITIATTGTGTFGNVSTAGALTATGNITGGNITTTGYANLGITQVNGNLIVTGNISATGNITYINVSDLVVSDPLLFLAANNPGDVEDIGLVANYNPGGGNLHTGFARDYTDGTWKVFQGVTSNPNTVIAWNEAVYAPFKAGSILSNAAITANGNVTGANFSSAGIVTATGNITGGNIRSNAAITGTTLVVSGNATSGNLIANYIYGDISNATNGFGNNAVLALLSSNTSYNITTTGGITANTVQAQYLYGNGTFITGLPATFGNANLVAYGEAGWSGNIIPAANGAYNLGNNSNRWNDVYINSTLYLPFQTLTSNGTRIIASSSLSAYDFISTNDITAAANITATGNVSGSYVLGNIRFSTGGYNDANVAAYTGALTNLTGNVTTTANISGSYILGNIRSATGGYDDANVAAYTGALTNLTGNVTTTANVQGAYVLGNGAFLTGIEAGYSNADVANYLPTYTGALPNLTGNVTTTANVQGSYILGNGYFLSGISGGGGSTYGNANVGDYLASNAAITVLTTANITTAANVAGNYFIGNGAFLTGLNFTNYSNANVANYLASNAAVTITTTANISSSTNVNAGNFSGTGVNTNIRTGSQLWTFGSTGTLTIPGNVNANNYYINNLTNPVQDQDAATKIYVDNLASTSISYHEAVLAATTGTLAAATGGTITYNQVNGVGNGIGATLTTTGSFNLIDTANVQTANTRILVKNEANGTHNGVYVWSNATAITRASTENTAGVANVDAFGINDYFYTTGGNINKGSAFIVDAPNTAIVFGTSNIQFAVFSQSQVYSANTAAGISLATTTISAKIDNITTAFDGSGNISVKAGAILTTPNIGAATGTSLNVTGNITSSANISGANFVGGSSSNTTIRTGIYNWTFGNTGNFTLPGNTFAVNYANGAQVSLGGSYSNADVANYLASNAAVTILTTGNITANNFIGAAGSDPNVGLIAGTYTWNFDNTGNLTLPGNTFAVNYANGTQISLYGNSNVATYLASNAAVTVLTTANITTTANVAGTFFIGNGAFLTGIAGGGGGSYGNSNVADYLASNAAVTIRTTANITSAANVAAGNFVGTSSSNTTIKTGAFTWTFDQAGNLNINSASGTIVGSNANTTIQTGANRWNFASDGLLYLPGNIVAGYRDIPQLSWTGSPTLALGDEGKHYYTASGGTTINIPTNATVPFPIGTAITLVNQSGSNCTINTSGLVSLFVSGIGGGTVPQTRTLGAYSVATLIKVNTNAWFVSGNLVV